MNRQIPPRRWIRRPKYPKMLNADPRDTTAAILQWLAWYQAGALNFAACYVPKTETPFAL